MKSLNFKNLLIAIISITIIFSCTKNSNEKKSSSEKVQTNQVKKDSLLKLLAGNYSGILPCADCEQIKYNLSLQPGMNFTSEMIYVGKDVKTAVCKWNLESDG